MIASEPATLVGPDDEVITLDDEDILEDSAPFLQLAVCQVHCR